MTHPFNNQNDVRTDIMGNSLVLDFSQMPLAKLVNLRQSGEGLSAKECDSWHMAATSAIDGLGRRIDWSLDAYVRLGTKPYSIEVLVPLAAADTINKLVQPVIDFFGREGIRVEQPSTLRPRSVAQQI